MSQQNVHSLPTPLKMLTALLAVVTLTGAFNYTLDPHGIWHAWGISSKYTKASRGREFPAYAVHTRGKVHTALVGSSRTRSGFWMQSPERAGILNTGMAGAAVLENIWSVEQLSLRDDLETIFFEASFVTYATVWFTPDLDLTLSRIRGELGVMISETLFSANALKASYRKLLRRVRGLRKDDALPIPWPVDVLEVKLQHATQPLPEDQLLPVEGEPHNFHPDDPRIIESMNERMGWLASAVEEARSRGKKVALFIPPVSEYQMEAIRQGGAWPSFQQWKRELAKIAPTYDFTGYHEIARMTRLFRDSSHFLPTLGWAMVHRMLGTPESEVGEHLARVFACCSYLTPESVDEQLKRQNEQMEASLGRPSAFRDRIAELDRQSPGRNPD